MGRGYGSSGVAAVLRNGLSHHNAAVIGGNAGKRCFWKRTCSTAGSSRFESGLALHSAFCRAPFMLGYLPARNGRYSGSAGGPNAGWEHRVTDRQNPLFAFRAIFLCPVSTRSSWVLVSQSCKYVGQRRSDSVLLRQSPLGDPLFLP